MLRVRVNGDFTIGGMMMIGRNGASKAIALSLSEFGWSARLESAIFPSFFFFGARGLRERKGEREREEGRRRERRARDDGTVD